MRAVVLIREPYQPALGGVPLRNQQNIESLKQLGKVAIFSLHKGQPSPLSGLGFLASMHGNMSCPDRQLIEKIKSRLRWLRRDGHYYADWLYTHSQASLFSAFLERVQPNLILFEELWFYHYLPAARAYQQRNSHCKIIVDNHNVEGLLAQEQSELEQATTLSDRIELAIRPQQVFHLEAQMLQQVDQVWTCSEVDAAVMRSHYASTPSSHHLSQKLMVLPNGVDVERYAPTPPLAKATAKGRSKPAQLLFLGSFGYAPNAEAARILIEEIYPQVQQSNPTAQLMLVGRGPTPGMQAAAEQNSNITVTGQVDSVLPYLQDADVMVVPLRHGSGTRLKLLESFAARLPVISTRKGAEGLAVVDGQHLLLRDQSCDIAAAIDQVLSSLALRQRLTQSAHQLVQSEYSWTAATSKIAQAANQLGLLSRDQQLAHDRQLDQNRTPLQNRPFIQDPQPARPWKLSNGATLEKQS